MLSTVILVIAVPTLFGADKTAMSTRSALKLIHATVRGHAVKECVLVIPTLTVFLLVLPVCLKTLAKLTKVLVSLIELVMLTLFASITDLVLLVSVMLAIRQIMIAQLIGWLATYSYLYILF